MINQPEDLKTVQKQVEDARNTLTVIYHDHERIKALRASEDYALGEQSKLKAMLDETIRGLGDEQARLQSDIESKKVQVMELDGQIAESTKRHQDTKSSIEELESSRSEGIAEATKREKMTADKEIAVSKREDAASNREQALERKEQIIEEFKNSL